LELSNLANFGFVSDFDIRISDLEKMDLPTTKPAQFTSLFSNSVLSRVEKMRIGSSRRFTSKHRGEHLAGREGSSNEFSDYRDYAAGDDIRFVDWNIFSRLQRPYLKLFHQEEEMHVAIIVDASASMQFEGKLLRAKQVAAAFSVMGLMCGEQVSVYAINATDTNPIRVPPSRGRPSMRKMITGIEAIESGGDAAVEKGVDQVLKRHNGRGVCLLISDFLTFGDLKRSFNLLFGAGLEIFALQILGPSEIDPGVNGDIRLVDVETDLTLDISSAAQLVAIYQEYREQFEADLHEMVRQRAGRFICTNATTPIEDLLFDTMMRRGWTQ
jgi:uncharacterized protein (DUF58 family)